MIPLRRSEKIFLVIVVMLLAVVLVYDLIVWESKGRQVSRLRDKVVNLDREIYQLRSQIGSENAIQENVVQSKERLEELKSRLPDLEELPSILKFLAREGEAKDLEITSIDRGQEMDFILPTKKTKFSFDGKVCKMAGFNIKMIGGYIALGEYLRALWEKPYVIYVQNMQISKYARIKGALDVELRLAMLFLAEPSKP